ncbi:MAG TPA: class I SAM-dependent methyltransferase [Gemmatimonadales bacterium]|nr:class I SAM-dependent methyltransferase [Gemmatimonadales bacterium]
MTASSSTDLFPLRIGTRDEFAQLESFLRQAGFDEEGVCLAMKIPNLKLLGGALREPSRLASAEPPLLALLIRLFIAGESVAASDVERLVDPGVRAVLLALDLVRRAPVDGPNAYAATVFLYPVEGVFITSDRHAPGSGDDWKPPPDVVFPALFHGTQRFLHLLPPGRADDALDLCSGSGVAAFVLSRHARRAVASDITPRAMHFCAFNRLLNRRLNVEVAQGDLYEAVPGQTFDVIVAHPPYVPSQSITHIYRDGGVTGEEIIRRVIAGLPGALRPGGVFHMVCAAWDAKNAPFEDRVRAWLGSSAAEFDVLFALQSGTPAAEVASDAAKHGQGDHALPSRWQQLFNEAELEQNVYGALVLARAPAGTVGSRRPVTRRVRLSVLTDAMAFPVLFERLHWLDAHERGGDLTAALVGQRPRPAPHLRVEMAYAPGAAGLVRENVVLIADWPFAARTQIDPWMFELVARLDGSRTLEAAYRSVRDSGEMPEAFRVEDSVKLIALGIERGYWNVEYGEPSGSAAPGDPGLHAG